MSAALVLAGIALLMASGVPSLGRRTAFATTPMLLGGSAAGLAGTVLGLTGGAPSTLALPWQVPGAAAVLRIDALSAFFSAPVFLLAGAGGLYATRTWPATRARAGHVRTFFGLMAGALALAMTAGNTILFLAAWEIVAVSSFFLIATDHEDPASRSAGWVYLAASHAATLALFGVVTLLHSLTGSWSFEGLPSGTGASAEGSAILWLGLFAFGLKAGIMPLHIWLPAAHAAAPSHVSALMSGVAIKMGIYGLVRVLSLFDLVPRSFGTVFLVAGLASSILGVAFALAQHDLKRLLAYHSIENIGIIVTGLGVGLVGQSQGRPLVALLGFGGALLHVWNHALFKSLLFLSAGAAIHEVHTREMDRMGGLARRMPWTAAAFLLGAGAISGLPPLNGFVSEWLLYVAGFTAMTGPWDGASELFLVLVPPALALTGALALACFVKAFGAVFLGTPRSSAAGEARESAGAMRGAMLPLALACIAIGLVPTLVAPLLGRVVASAAPALEISDAMTALLRPARTAALILAAAGAALTLALLASRRRAAAAPTWDCGYAAPNARMQYTSSSLARGLTALFAWALRPAVHAPSSLNLFPTAARLHTDVPDTVLDRGLLPLLRGLARVLGFARWIQHGRMQIYLVYLGATLLVLLAWSAR